MKKLLVAIVVIAGAWIGWNYIRTGQISILPTEMSEEDRRLQDLEEELASIKSQIAQAGRSAGMTGIDTSGDVAALIERKEDIEEEIAEIRARRR